MKSLKLNVSQQIQLEAFCAFQGGTVAELRRFMKIANVVGISAEMKAQINYREIGPGEIAWDDKGLPIEPNVFQLEDADAAALKAKLEGWQWPPATARRVMQWLEPVLEQL